MVKTLQIASCLDQVQWVSRQLVGLLKKENWSADSLFAVRLAVEEALVNAIRHGNQENPTKKVSFQFRLNSQRNQVTICIKDQGRGFDPRQLSTTGGYGLVLIHQLMDEVRYNRKGNRLEMVKKRD